MSFAADLLLQTEWEVVVVEENTAAEFEIQREGPER